MKIIVELDLNDQDSKNTIVEAIHESVIKCSTDASFEKTVRIAINKAIKNYFADVDMYDEFEEVIKPQVKTLLRNALAKGGN